MGRIGPFTVESAMETMVGQRVLSYLRQIVIYVKSKGPITGNYPGRGYGQAGVTGSQSEPDRPSGADA